MGKKWKTKGRKEEIENRICSYYDCSELLSVFSLVQREERRGGEGKRAKRATSIYFVFSSEHVEAYFLTEFKTYSQKIQKKKRKGQEWKKMERKKSKQMKKVERKNDRVKEKEKINRAWLFYVNFSELKQKDRRGKDTGKENKEKVKKQRQNGGKRKMRWKLHEKEDNIKERIRIFERKELKMDDENEKLTAVNYGQL